MLTRATLKFLRDLKQNNRRDWFEKHRAAYEAGRAEFVTLVDHLLGGIASFDPPIVEQEPEDCVYRIYRDVRFGKNKTPYKPNFGAFMSDRGRKLARAGYYVHVEPGGCFLAGGLYMPPTPELKAVRRAILHDGDALRRIVRARPFVKAFGKELPGAKLKTVPRDVTADHPCADLLRMKSFEIWCPYKDGLVLKPDFVPWAARTFRLMRDYVHYLNRALDRWLS